MQTIGSYVLGVVGLVMLLRAVIPAMSGTLKYPNARLLMTNMLRTNPRQAEAMCRSVDGTFFEAIGAAIKAGAMMQSRDPALLCKATAPSYDASGAAVNQRWNGLLMKGKLGAMAAGGAVALGFSGDSTPILMIVLAVVVLGGLGWLMLKKADVERSILLARAEVLPEVDRLFVDGRY